MNIKPNRIKSNQIKSEQTNLNEPVMPSFTLDTFKAIKSMTEAGLSEDASKAVVETIKQSLDGNIVTKADLLEAKVEMKEGTAELKAEIKAELKQSTAEVKAELKAEVTEVKAEVAEVKAEVSEVKAEVTEIKVEVSEIKVEIYKMKNSLMIWMTVIFSIGFTALGFFQAL